MTAHRNDNDTGRVAVPETGNFDDSDVESHLTDDAGAMTTQTIASGAVEETSDRSSDRPAAPRGRGAEKDTIENEGFCAQNFENVLYPRSRCDGPKHIHPLGMPAPSAEDDTHNTTIIQNHDDNDSRLPMMREYTYDMLQYCLGSTA